MNVSQDASGQDAGEGQGAGKRAAFVVVLILLAGTTIGLAGTDLILPAVPAFAALFDSTSETAQYVIASYVAGYAIGLLLFGWLADLFARRWLLIGASAGFAVSSLALAALSVPAAIIAVRTGQGICAAAPAVFAPAIVKALFDETAATRVLGALASIESLAPALAPIVGLWLFAIGGWSLSFTVLAMLAAGVLIALIAAMGAVPEKARGARASGATYLALMRRPVYMRYCVSQAASIGGLLVFVFSAPTVIVDGLGGAPADFVKMQIIGIVGFILAANASGGLAKRFGAEALITFGTALSFVAALALLAYGLSGGARIAVLFALFAPFNVGLGLRGPPGFLRAIMAGSGGEDRAASLVILFAMGIAAGATAIVAPFIGVGLVAPALAGGVIMGAAVLMLMVLPRLPEESGR